MNQEQAAKPPQRVVTRSVMAFIIDLVVRHTAAQGGDLLCGLLFMTISQSNVEHLLGQPDLHHSFGSDDLPDEALRPIAVHALAVVLALPPETVRRHVDALIRNGRCVRVGKRGVIIPGRVLASSPFDELNDATFTAFSRVLEDLSAIGFDPMDGTFKAPAEGGAVTLRRNAPRHLTLRIVHELALRCVLDGTTIYRNFMDALFFTTIMHLNSRHINQDAELAWRYATAQAAPPDALRRPVSVRQLAAYLGLPYATVHRHVSKMVREGRIVRSEAGVVLPTVAAQDPAVLKGGLYVYNWFLFTVRRLAGEGALDFPRSLSPSGAQASLRQPRSAITA